MSSDAQPFPTRRSLRQNRRAESEAGAPSGQDVAPAFIELPAPTTEPADTTAWTGHVPQVAPAPGDEPAADQVDEEAPATPAVPQPRTRREARRLREQGLLPDTPGESASSAPDAPTLSRARRADAPVASPGSSDQDREREEIAREAEELAELMAASDPSDPTRVDPEIQRRQQALAERAARLNAPAEGPASGPAETDPGAADRVPEPRPALERQAPVEASTAHGLDSLDAAEASRRERTLLLIAAAALAVGLFALVIALILTAT